jgi:hypothetical protein
MKLSRFGRAVQIRGIVAKIESATGASKRGLIIAAALHVETNFENELAPDLAKVVNPVDGCIVVEERSVVGAEFRRVGKP